MGIKANTLSEETVKLYCTHRWVNYSGMLNDEARIIYGDLKKCPRCETWWKGGEPEPKVEIAHDENS